MEYFNINEVPSTPQLAELIKILLPQKITTIIDALASFKNLKHLKEITMEVPKNRQLSCDKVELIDAKEALEGITSHTIDPRTNPKANRKVGKMPKSTHPGIRTASVKSEAITIVA